ncbi:TIGR02269 family lipoprotein [Archangium lansingense]|uniref:SitA6 family polymorphic toxin lipoprotein n=1 Tax=Archangium lansingense TaxID=2995310 RepID=UPI003B7899D0
MRPLQTLCLLLVGSLFACATPSPVLQGGGPIPEPEVVATWEEGCEDERSLVLLCREEGQECGFFHCHEAVRDEEVLLASRGGGPLYIPGPSPRGWRGRPIGWPRNTRPVLTFRFNRHFDPKPPLPALPPGRWVKHHLFPQAEELREWFHARGVPDIHQYTMLIPEHVHIRIHSQGPRGGRWNQAWLNFKRAKPNAFPEEIYRHAGELIFRFELTGPIVPYARGGR